MEQRLTEPRLPMRAAEGEGKTQVVGRSAARPSRYHAGIRAFITNLRLSRPLNVMIPRLLSTGKADSVRWYTIP
jgi:hypothetical protein